MGKEATWVKPTGDRSHLRKQVHPKTLLFPCVPFFGWPGTQPASASLGLKAPRSIPRPKRNAASLPLYFSLANTIRERGGKKKSIPEFSHYLRKRQAIVRDINFHNYNMLQ